MPKFVDRVRIHVTAGKGGHGCASVHREKFKPLGGPDGGNGGNGGSVILRANQEIHTLLDFHFHPNVKAYNGKPGQGNNRSGATAEDRVLQVPLGTVVLSSQGEVLADMVANGQEYVAAAGGKGGLGNAALASSRRKVPGFALLGEEGVEKDLFLELKSVADVGLVGFPSAGKSSLVSVMSKAKPQIADYPFTTLTPNLGVVSVGQYIHTVADVPGLIVGAAEGKGLGFDFLRHIERCAVLAHVVDCSVYEVDRNPVADIEALENELEIYERTTQESWIADLSSRPRIIVLNKMDDPTAVEMVEIQREELKKFGWPIFEISAVTGQGVKELSFALGEIVDKYRAEHPVEVKQASVIKIIDEEDTEFEVKKAMDGNGFVVSGYRPEKWIQQTQFDNDEAIGFLADRLAKLGVEEKLVELKAKPGDLVTIGDYSFEWEPDVQSGGNEFMATTRGEDIRLNDNHRVAAAERKILKKQRRVNKYEEDI